MTTLMCRCGGRRVAHRSADGDDSAADDTDDAVDGDDDADARR